MGDGSTQGVARATSRRSIGFWVATSLVCAVVALAAGYGAWSGLASTPRTPAALGDVGIIEPPLSAPTSEVYAYPGALSSLVFSRPAGASSVRQYLGRALVAQAVPTLGEPRRYVVFGQTADVLVGTRGRASLVARLHDHSNTDDGVLLVIGDDAYVTWYGGVDEVKLSSGAVIRQFSLVGLPYKPSPFQMYAGDPIGVLSVLADGGDLFALESNTQSSAIVNLTTHASRLFRGVALVPGAALATDGYLYVFEWDPTHSRMGVLRIDPRTLHVASDFTVPLHVKRFVNVQVQALRTGGVVVFVTASLSDNGGAGIDNFLWRVSAAGLVALPLPIRGLFMSVFGHVVYIYGGANQNEVSTVNLDTGAVARRVPSLATAPGTYIYDLE